MKRRWWTVTAGLLVLVGVMAALLGFQRLRQAPEWLARSGDPAVRIQACYGFWEKNPRRARLGLEALLADPVPEVQLAALEAVTRAQLPMGHQVEALTKAADPQVRARAWEWLLDPRMNDDEPVRRLAGLLDADAEAKRQELRSVLPLFARRVYADCPELLDEHPHAFLDIALLDPHEYPRLMAALLVQGEALAPHRDYLISCLEREALSHSRRHFLLEALAAIDGVMRGYTAADWRQADATIPVEPAPPVDGFVVEAEWAYALQPNFMIEAFKGERALVLHEGAGGYMSWLGRDRSTVDIGTGKLPFTLSKAGTYVLWARVHMDDKCGNSTGMTVDGREYSAFSDAEDVFHEWVWMAHGEMWLSEGRHSLDLKALEDGVQVDKYAILPRGEHPTDSPARRNALYDPAMLPAISFTAEMQQQLRGTTQTVTVWVRRHTLSMTGGSLKFNVPEPFELIDDRPTDIVFTGDEPLARTSFRVELPERARGGEVTIEATLRDASERKLAAGSFVLGVQPDWYTTGRLEMDDPLASRLMRDKRVARSEVLERWQPFPREGYDRYRRLNLEDAFGQSQDCITFLYTELEVTEAGTYTSFLTADDTAAVCIEGTVIAEIVNSGPAEGRMREAATELPAGRVGVLVWVTQADFADPVDKPDRHSQNNWVFKWLLRENRHTPATAIVTVPLTRD